MFTLQTEINESDSNGNLSDNDNDGIIESSLYTGIYILEELQFNKDTGRATLPKSAFTKEYMKLPPILTNPYL